MNACTSGDNAERQLAVFIALPVSCTRRRYRGPTPCAALHTKFAASSVLPVPV